MSHFLLVDFEEVVLENVSKFRILTPKVSPVVQVALGHELLLQKQVAAEPILLLV